MKTNYVRRFSFRTRLTITITIVFVITGIGLLTAQYAALNWMLDQTITAIQSDSEVAVNEMEDGTVIVDGDASASGLAGVQQTAFAEQSAELARDVVSGVMVASSVILGIFIILAALLSVWISRGATQRIAELTEATREISERDLHLRLALPGPRDEVTDLGDTIDEMLTRLESAFTSQDRFIANASHELRTPLATTRIALQVPLRQGRVTDELTPEIERALAANSRSEQLIEALLVLAKGRFSTAAMYSVTSLDEIVRDELEDIRPDIEQAGLTVSIAIEGVTVFGFAPLIRQAVRNILDNAIKHNVDGGSISVQVSDTNATGSFTVTNTGIISDPNEVALLKEPFHRGTSTRTRSPARSEQGLGLGLSIVASIAESHHGRLNLTALEAGGMTVQITLPCVPKTA